MSKLNWDKADRRECDPGSVVEVPDTVRPWTPPETRKLRDAERAEERRALKKRSEQHDMDRFTLQVETRIRRKEDLGIELNSMEKLLRSKFGKPL